VADGQSSLSAERSGCVWSDAVDLLDAVSTVFFASAALCAIGTWMRGADRGAEMGSGRRGWVVRSTGIALVVRRMVLSLRLP